MSNVAKLKAALGTKDEAALFTANTFQAKSGEHVGIVNVRNARRGVSPATILLIAENLEEAIQAAVDSLDAAKAANEAPAPKVEKVESGAKQSVAELKKKLAQAG